MVYSFGFSIKAFYLRLNTLARSIIIVLLLFFLSAGCNQTRYVTVKHVKPDNRNRPYNKKKDRRKKRVKYVRVKILKQSKEVKPPRAKPVKAKKTKETTTEETATGEIEPPAEPTHEPDSTGLF